MAAVLPLLSILTLLGTQEPAAVETPDSQEASELFLPGLADESLYIYSLAPFLGMIALRVFIAWPFQMFWPAVKRPWKVLSYEYWLDVLYACQEIWLTQLSFYAAINFVKHAIHDDAELLLPQLATLPWWSQILLSVFALDFIVYWRHRLEHTLSALWAFHAVHHSTEAVDTLTTTRLHPFELAFGSLTGTLVFCLGLEAKAIGIGFSIYLYYNYFIHTNVRVRFPGPLKYILVSPFMHQWHHAVDKESIGKNVGVVFAWNDWLFGTAYHPQHWPSRFGIDAPPAEHVPQSYIRQLVYPLQYAWAKLQPKHETVPLASTPTHVDSPRLS